MIGYGITKNHVAISARRDELFALLRLVAAGCYVQQGMTAGLARCIHRKVDALNETSTTSAVLDAINEIIHIAEDVEASAKLFQEIMEQSETPA